jgi:hypothetical protein
MHERPNDFTAPLIDAVSPRETRQNKTMGLSLETRYVNGRYQVVGYEVAEFSNHREQNSAAGLLAFGSVVVALVTLFAALSLFG